ncbi:MAG: radical SAM family heme chaperone HemW [Thermoanaerobaculia bacterium]
MVAALPQLAVASPGLYVHLPFCSAVCPYCDFAVARASEGRRLRFVESLLAEIRLVAPVEKADFDTLYFGGGTPSILPPEELGRLIATCRAELGLSEQAWLFLEANPEDVRLETLLAWRELGVHTLSLGVQSFDDAELAFLGRRHRGLEAARAVALAREAGFPTLSIDLIYGLPSQAAGAWRGQLERALSLGIDHLSCYQLTVHPATAFGKRRRQGALFELPEPEQAALFELTHRVLADHGLPAYEVSNFAAGPEHRSRHNLKYWHHQPYLGLGPSAHSFDGGRRRFWNERRVDPYGQRLRMGERPLAGEEVLSRSELALEALMLGLRTTEGLDLQTFAGRFGCDLIATNARRLAELERGGLLEMGAGRLRLSLAGLALADGLAASLELGDIPN